MLDLIYRVAMAGMALIASVACFLFAISFTLEGFMIGGIVVILFSVFVSMVSLLVGAVFVILAWRFWADD